jgi:hypothetical protein
MTIQRINRKNIISHLLEFQLALAGKKITDMMDAHNWRFEFTITNDQLGQFRNYSVPLLKKIFRFNKIKAEETFEWFWKNFGLRIKNL